MGTRALTVFEDEGGKEIAVLYRQYDGYPEAHGVELGEFLAGRNVVNGRINGAINGANDCAAQVVAYFKCGQAAPTLPQAGAFYLFAAGTRDCGEQYIYIVRCPTVGEPPTVECAVAGAQRGQREVLKAACPAPEFAAWASAQGGA